MASILFTIGGVVMNTLAFSGTNFFFSKLIDCHGQKELKRHDLPENKFQKARNEWNEDKMKRPDLSIKICVKRMKQHMLFTTALSK